MNESIFLTIKRMITGSTFFDSEDAFDQDIMLHINTYLGVLNQLGVGVPGFEVTGESETWEDFLEANSVSLNEVKTYLYLRVRQVFDPPASSVLGQAFDKQIDELGWRIMEKVALLDSDNS